MLAAHYEGIRDIYFSKSEIIHNHNLKKLWNSTNNY